MARIPGRQMRVKVGSTVTGPFSLVGGMNSFSKNTRRATTQVSAFEDAVAESFPGDRTQTIALRGSVLPVDAGQQLLRDAEAADNTVFVQVLPQGGSSVTADQVKGYVQEYRVTSIGPHDASTQPGAQGYGFDLEAVGDAITSGTGGYIV